LYTVLNCQRHDSYALADAGGVAGMIEAKRRGEGVRIVQKAGREAKEPSTP